MISRCTVSRGLLAIAGTCLLGASAALAQAMSPGTPEAPLSTVTVIGTTPLPGIGQALSEIPAPAQTATAADLQQSQALDLSSFLNRNLGGVFINEMQGNPFQPDVNFRGFAASPLLGTPQGLSIYMDGVRLNQPFGDVVSWDLIPRMAIQSLTLMPGSNPLYGLNTLGGALSIQAKDGRTSPGTALQTTLGSNQRWAQEFEHGGSNSLGAHWYITANRFGENGWRDSSPSSVQQLFGKLGWASANTDVSLTMALADNTLTGNGLQEQRLLAQNYLSVYSKPDATVNKSGFLNLGLKHALNGESLLSGNVYYRSIQTNSTNGDVNEGVLDQNLYRLPGTERAALRAAGYSGFRTPGGANATNTPFPFWTCLANVLTNDAPAEKCNGLITHANSSQENYGLSGQLTLLKDWAGQRNQFTGGFAYDASQARFTQSTQLGYLNPDRSITGVNAFGDGVSGGTLNGAPYDTRVDLGGSTRTVSLFATNTLSLQERWHITLAGRFNRTQVDNRDAITPGGGAGSLDGSHVFERFNPAIGITFTPSHGWNAYLGYNEGSRTPTSVELGCADPANPCKLPNAMAGDPPLRQVVTQTWEIGLRGQLTPTVAWNAGVFRADNYDDILFVAGNAAGFGYFKNFGQTRRQGLELGLNGTISRWTAAASYTLLDATFQSYETVNGTANSSNNATAPGLSGNINIQPGNQIPLVPRHQFKMHFDYRAAAAWAVGMGMNAVSGSYARGNENNQHQADGVNFLGAGETGGFTLFDLSLRYSASPRWSFFVQINNLFDRQYASAALLGATAFDAKGNFVARPLPAVGTDYPLLQSTFYAPGAPRSFSFGLRYDFDKPSP